MATRRSARFVSPASVSVAAGAPVPLGRRSICVRLCDGFFFPVGDLRDENDIAGHEAACASQCPGAPTKLYMEPGGTDKIDDAYSARGHKPYSALPVAYRHASATGDFCSCHAATAQPALAILRDFTLRKGDSVATPLGIKVFRGAQHWPYKRNDFVGLNQAKELNEQERGTLTALERAAKGLKPVVKSTGKAEDAKNYTPLASRRDGEGRQVRQVGPQALLLTQ